MVKIKAVLVSSSGVNTPNETIQQATMSRYVRPPKVQRIIHRIIAPSGGIKDKSKFKIVK